eukprot:TRINITY_DN103523_c0_g1_i1.p1 TRINITY_DN103523_c0_g1~~TRINITY_DN103523_c0_g1_i1.p1  ORF type:complete len:322 (+),score=54.42 TRINITY_DN103523_c0_g1_i1:13-978(+)
MQVTHMAESAARPDRFAHLAAVLRECKAEDVDDNPPSEILKGFLFLGDAHNASSISQLHKYGITRILSVVTSPEIGVHEGIERKYFCIRDSEDEHIAAFFSPACEFIERAKNDEARLLVHCMAGRSRSASVVLAFLMRSEGMSLLDAFELTKRKRPIVFPNVGFWQQLMDEEIKCLGSSSEVPSAYKAVLEIRLGKRDLTPGILLKKYITAASLPDPTHSDDVRNEAVNEWPSGWPASKCIEDLFMSSIEHLRSDARQLAVEFIGRLLRGKRFTRAEVLEAFALLEGMDLDDLRIDVPKVDEYIAEMLEAAATQKLLSIAA